MPGTIGYSRTVINLSDSLQSATMNKINVAVFFVALLIIGACAEPRKMLAGTEEGKVVEAQEHQRILAELEEVHALRERMLQEGEHFFVWSGAVHHTVYLN